MVKNSHSSKIFQKLTLSSVGLLVLAVAGSVVMTPGRAFAEDPAPDCAEYTPQVLQADGTTVNGTTYYLCGNATTPAHSTFSVKVNSFLTLELTGDGGNYGTNPDGSPKQGLTIDVNSNMVGIGIFSAKVTTNKKYALYINGLNGQTAMKHADNTVAESIPGSGDVRVGSSAWGVKALGFGDTEEYDASDVFRAIPAVANEDAVFYRSAESNVTNAETKFKVGISVGASLPSGSYSGTLVVTAANV